MKFGEHDVQVERNSKISSSPIGDAPCVCVEQWSSTNEAQKSQITKFAPNSLKFGGDLP